MTNNILKEIKNEFINKGKEPHTDNFDQYISQNKIFTFLFASKIIPEFSSMLSSLNTLYTSNEKVKLIICICSDTKDEFDDSLSDINDDISCLIFNYESKNRQILISKYNIISIPTLIIIDKDGVLIDSLNMEQIKNLNESDIKGWENKFVVTNLYKNKKLEIGDTCILSVHKHILIYSNNSMKPGYGNSGWTCDICGRGYSSRDVNFFCPLCGWDLCDICYNKYKDENDFNIF